MISRIVSILGVAALPSIALCDVQFTGVNLSGAEFGPGVGTYNTTYTWPREAEIDYFVGKGMNIIRLPFKWERLQRELGEPFDEAELARLQSVVAYATAAGAHVILDPHNYARYNGTIIGTGNVSNAHFADLWIRLADLYKDNDKVIFGLVNEPHSMPSTEHWVTSANIAIKAIRDTGAENLILVPGNAFSGAHSWTGDWYGTPNAAAMLEIVDPKDNYAFDIHQYLDGDSSGRSPDIVNANIGAQRLNVFTQWALEHNKRGFLGEFAVANSTIGDGESQIGDEALTLMLDHMNENDTVWLGWTWWSAGPWWNDYMFTMEPIDLGKPTQADRPSMQVVEPRLVGVPEPAGAMLLPPAAALALKRLRRDAEPGIEVTTPVSGPGVHITKEVTLGESVAR